MSIDMHNLNWEMECSKKIIDADVKPCSVVIKKLTDAEILQYTTIKHLDENKLERTNKKNYGQSLRRNSKDFELYENYKRQRQKYIRRRNRLPDAYYSTEEASDNFGSCDTSSNGMKHKKRRFRRKLAYEDDLEWSPNEQKSSKYRRNSHSQIRPRRKVYRPMVIDSDSDSDFEYKEFYPPFPDSVDYDEKNISVNEASGGNAYSNDCAASKSSDNQNDHAADILSGIIKQMDVLDNDRRKVKSVRVKFPVNKKQHDPDNTKNTVLGMKKKRSRAKTTKETSELFLKRIVQNVMDDIVNSVCVNERKGIKHINGIRALNRVCKWCNTPFAAKSESELLCVICRDVHRGNYKLLNEVHKKPKRFKKDKTVSPPKTTKNVSKTMNKILKKLPKYEKQRLMYSEKADKCSVEKGYNHCKSFATPKEEKNVPNDSENSGQFNVPKLGRESLGINTKKQKKHSHLSTAEGLSKKTPGRRKKSNLTDEVSEPPKKSRKIALETEPVKNVAVSSDKPKKLLPKVKENNEQVSVTNVDKGLFLMTFPEPDKELDLNICPKDTKSAVSKQGNMSLGIQPGREKKDFSKNVVPEYASPVDKKFINSPVVNNLQYKTYFFPPVPTVVVANYAATDASTSDYFLSSVYYQNELTQSKRSSYIKNMLVGNTNNNSTLSDNLNSNRLLATKQIPSGRIQSNTPVFHTGCQNAPLIRPDEKAYSAMINVNTDMLAKNTNMIQSSLLPVKHSDSTSLFYNVCSNSITSDAATNVENSLNIAGSVPQVPRMMQPSNASVPTHDESNYSVNPCLASEVMDNAQEMQIKITHVTSERNAAHELAHTFSDDQQQDLNFQYLNTLNSIENSNESVENSNASSLSVSFNQSSVEDEHEMHSSVNHVPVSDSGKEALSNSNSEQLSSEKELTSISNKESVDECNKIKGSPSESNSSASKSLNDLKLLNDQNSNLTEPLQTVRNSVIVENVNNSETLLEESYHEIDAISILGVLDFELNPRLKLNATIETAKSEISELINSKKEDKESIEKLCACQKSFKTLQFAHKLLSRFGSFSFVSEHYLGKQKIVKKEKASEEERQSCQFSQSSLAKLLQNAPGIANSSDVTNTASKVNVKSENLSSCSLSETDSSCPVNHIEKIQTQINSMNHNSHSESLVHSNISPHISPMHFPEAAAAASFAPRTDTMGDSRETPSRGSGPITPARPESATSQPDEPTLTPVQIKKERLESASSPVTQCALPQNTASSFDTSPLAVISVANTMDSTRYSNGASILSSVNMNVHPVPSVPQYQTNEIPPNRTVPFNAGQNFSKVLLNFAKQQATPNMPTVNPVAKQNGHILNVQQVYLPGGAGLSQRTAVQPVPSNLSANQFIIKQPQMSSTSAAGGTVLVNNNTVGGQTVYPVLNNVCNQQVYTSSPVPQVYYTTTAQQPSNSQNQVACQPPPYVSQNKLSPNETVEQMFCAVCKKVAKLRCKQCAKVAYCDTNCAKTYWHQKHKMECKSMTSCP